MISNITNALPALLKRLKTKDENIKMNFDLVEMLNFYGSILPKSKSSFGLKHIFLDCIFRFKDESFDIAEGLQISIDTLPFLKEFEYIIDDENNALIIRSNMEELSIFSLIMITSIRNLPENEVKNHSIFITLAMHYLKFCLECGYNVCTLDDIGVLERYNEGFDNKVFESIGFIPTSERFIGTIHFIGIDLNKDIMKIFEKYKFIKFTYNEENASFIISMKSEDWDDFWNEAPQYLKTEFNDEAEHQMNIM